MTLNLSPDESRESYEKLSGAGSLPDPTTQRPASLPTLSIFSGEPSRTTSHLDPEQSTAVDIMQAGGNVFLSGMAGTGKSTTLLSFIGQSFRPVDVCATTGIAALNLQDQFRQRAGVALPAHTIYRWAGIALGPALGQSFENYWQFLNAGRMPMSRMAAFRRIARCEVLVIDEISMLPGRTLEYLNFHFQTIRDDKRPFGGIQLIAVGDFLQLPPVAKSGAYDWSFLSPSWKAARFQNAYLTTIHRQDEPIFIEALNNFREGRISRAVADTLTKRVKDFVDRRIVRLMTHNAQVDKWNKYQIGEIDAAERIYDAEFSGPDHECQFLAKNSITPTCLVLKVGARVMVTSNLTHQTCNDLPSGECNGCGSPMMYYGICRSCYTPNIPAEIGKLIAANGQCGTVKDMKIDSVIVILDGKRSHVEIGQSVWNFDPQRDDSGKMTQIPLRPAYALTIHKSQGLTLDRAHIDIRAAREPGQAYVALSRLRSLSGLYLKDWIKGVHVSEAAINFYKGMS